MFARPVFILETVCVLLRKVASQRWFLHMKTKFIVNPSAGGGSCAAEWRKLLHTRITLFPDHDISYTKAPREATTLAVEALQNGFQKIIAAGGDGTLNEIVNGFLDKDNKPLNPSACLGMLSLGTGKDFPRNLGYPESAEEILKLLSCDRTKKIDIGKIQFQNGGVKTKYFINVASFGCSSEVVKKSLKMKKYFKKSSYIQTAGWVFLTAKPKTFTIKTEDNQEREFLSYNIFVSNGFSSGGNMRWSPQAKIDDGLFDITVLEKLPKWKLPLLVPKIYNGTLIHEKEVEVFRAKKIFVEASSDTEIEVDGELLGKLPASFEVLPKAVNFLY